MTGLNIDIYQGEMLPSVIIFVTASLVGRWLYPWQNSSTPRHDIKVYPYVSFFLSWKLQTNGESEIKILIMKEKLNTEQTWHYFR